MSLRTSEMRVIIAGDAASYLRTLAEVSAATDEASKGMSNSFDKSTSKVGGFFENMGQKMESWGIPFGKTVSDVGAKLDSTGSKASKFSGVMSDVGKLTLGVGAVAFAGIAAESIRLGISFQQAMTQVVTGAGELPQNLKADEHAIENMAGGVGQTTTALAKAFYTINSAGYHGSAGLKVLKASAEGASVGNAQLGTVADATTTILKAYGISASQSTSVVNQMIATEKVGKSHMEDLAGSLSAVLPIAAISHLSFAQVGGAIATMTSQGMSADQTTQDLAHAIRALENPNSVAVTEMQQMGLSSNNVAKNLGKRGLTGTLDLLTGTILKNMGPSGEVMLKAFNQSKAASADLQIMLGAMNPKMRALALEFESGSLTVSQFRKALPTNEQGVIQQFSTLYANAHGFNTMLKAGLPAAQTFQAALAKVTGGATGMNVALMLSGSHAATFQQNVKLIGDAAKHSGKNVTDFGMVQNTLAFQLTSAKDTLDGLGTAFGMMLIPWLEKGMKAVAGVVNWFGKNKAVAEALGGVIAGVLVTAIAIYVGGLALAAVRSVASFATMVAKGIWWAAQMMTSSGRANLAQQRAAKASQATAEQSSASAEQQVAANEEVATSSETTAATVETEGAATDAALETTGATAEAAGAAVDTAMGPVGIALAAVGLAAGLLMTHWKAVWNAIKVVLSDAWGFIKDHFALIMTVALGPLGIAIVLLKDHWKTVWKDIKIAVSDAWSILKPIFDAISGALSTIGKAASAVGGFFSSIFGGGSSGSSSAIQSHNIPHMAMGGLVTRPTLALIGEAGPEMVVPLSGASVNQPAGLPQGGDAAGSGSTVHIQYMPQINVTPVIGTQVSKQIEDMLAQHDQVLYSQLGAAVA